MTHNPQNIEPWPYQEAEQRSTIKRRDCLRTISGISFGGLASSVVGTAAATDAQGTNDPSNLYTVDPDRLVIREDDIPKGYEGIGLPSDIPLLPHLQDTDESFVGVETACSGYCVGRDLQNPRGAISSLAIVCEQIPNREPIETAATRCMDSLASAYERESAYDVTQTRHLKPEHGQWQIDLAREIGTGDDTEAATDPFGIDMMHIQYRRNVVLGTVVFGMHDQQPPVNQRLQRFARTQWIQLTQAVSTDE